MVFLTEKLLEENNINYNTVPTPKIDIVSCGVCIKVSETDKEKVKKILNQNSVEIAKMHDLD